MLAMNLPKKLKTFLSPNRTAPRPRRLRCESLEERRMLSVDPSWLFTLGGNANETTRSVAVAPNGDIVIAANFAQTVDVDPGPDTLNFTSASSFDDIIVARYSATDGSLIWARQYGALASDIANALEIDDAGNIYVAGYFGDAVDFTGDGVPDVTAGSGQFGTKDIFVLKLDDEGNTLWVSTAGGDSNDHAQGMSLDDDGNPYITGRIFSTTATFGTQSISGSGAGLSYYSKLDADGNFISVNGIGAAGAIWGNDVAVGGDGSVHVVGNFFGAAVEFGVDADGNTVTRSSPAGRTAFVAKYDSSGVVEWVTDQGNSGGAHGVSVDGLGNVYVAMEGALGLAKLDPDNGTLVATQGGVHSRDVALDADGTVYVTGGFGAQVVIDGQTLVGPGGLIAAFDANLNSLWMQRAGESGVTIAADGNGSVLVGGSFRDTVDFPTGDVRTSTGGNDLFLMKWNPQLPVINGNVFADTDGDGANDDSNRALPADWIVYLDKNLNGQRDAGDTVTTVDANGNYSFGNVPAGDYTIAQEVQSGWTQTLPLDGTGTPVPYVVTLNDGEFAPHFDFGSTMPTTTATFSSTDVPKRLKSNTTIASSVSIPDPAPGSPSSIFDIDVSVDYTDSNNDSKRVFIVLVSPAGTRVFLFGEDGFGDPTSLIGPGGLNVFVGFDDEPGGSGSLGPYRPLSALDGEDMAILPGFTYHAAFVRQKEEVDGSTDETGTALSATYQTKWGAVGITPFVEYVKFDDLGGADGKDRDFLTTALLLEWNNWNLAISRTGRDTEEADGSDFDDHLIQVSFGYEFDFGLLAELGWHTEKEDEENVTTNVVGVRLSYSRKF